MLREGVDLPGGDTGSKGGARVTHITEGMTEEQHKEYNENLIKTLPEKAVEALRGSNKNKGGKKNSRNRSGNGRYADPVEISQALKGLHKDEIIAEKHIAGLHASKDRLLFDLDDLRIKERQAEEHGYSSFTKNHIKKAITETQKELERVNGTLPAVNASADQRKIQRIITEWNEGKRDWRKELAQFKKAEGELKKHPEDRRVQGEANRARAEMKATSEKLEAVAHEAERIVNANTPNSALDEGISYTAKQATKDRAEWEEAHAHNKEVPPIATETIAQPEPQPVILNEHTTETGLEEKAMKPELPPLEYIVNETTPNDENHADRVAARTEEVAARQQELLEKTDTASLEEKAELEKETLSLASEQENIGATKPLQSAYDAAMDRLWKENETKRTPEKTSETITPEPAPVEGAPVGETMESAEEKFARVQKRLEQMNTETESRAAKLGMKTLDGVRAVGKWWNSQPRHYKVLFSTGLVLTGAGSALLGSTAVMGTVAAFGAATRALSGMALFAGMEEILKKQRERKTGEPITPGAAALDTFLAAALATTIATALPQAMHNMLEGTGVAEAAASAATEKQMPAGEIAPASGPESFEEWSRRIDERLSANGMDPERAKQFGASFSKALAEQDISRIREIEEEFGVTHNEILKMLGETQVELPEDLRNTLTTMESPAAPEMTTPTIPAEITPMSPEVLAYADQAIDRDMNTLFGSKGFLGFGATDWTKSIHMTDPGVGFGGKSVEDILNAHPSAHPAEGGATWGTEDSAATKKAQEYIQNIARDTGVSHEPGEKFLDYAKRAAATKVSTFMNQG